MLPPIHEKSPNLLITIVGLDDDEVYHFAQDGRYTLASWNDIYRWSSWKIEGNELWIKHSGEKWYVCDDKEDAYFVKCLQDARINKDMEKIILGIE